MQSHRIALTPLLASAALLGHALEQYTDSRSISSYGKHMAKSTVFTHSFSWARLGQLHIGRAPRRSGAASPMKWYDALYRVHEEPDNMPVVVSGRHSVPECPCGGATTLWSCALPTAPHV